MNKKLIAIALVVMLAIGGIAGALLLMGNPGKAAEDEEEKVASFEVLSVSSNRDTLLVGDDFQVTVEVKNTGTMDGNYSANLTVNGGNLVSKNVTVSMGKVKSVLFDLTAETTGNATIAVENKTTRVSIYAPVALGDYMVYRLEGYDAGTGETINETLTYTVTAIDNGTYTTLITYESGSNPPTVIVSYLGVQWSAGRANLTYVGSVGVSTYLGAMYLYHYHQEVEGLAYEYYVNYHANVMVKMVITDGTSTLTQTLIDTNRTWLADI